jgi:hypothetical protein
MLGLDDAEMAAASKSGAEYIDPTPWFCSTICTAIVDHYNVYLDQFHVTATYATYLENALAKDLGLLPPT